MIRIKFLYYFPSFKKMKVIIQKDREVVSWPLNGHTMYKEIWIWHYKLCNKFDIC